MGLDNQQVVACHPLTWVGYQSQPIITMFGNYLGIINQDSSVFKCQLVIFQKLFVNLMCISYIPLKWLVILLIFWTSYGNISSSTNLVVTNGRCSRSLDHNAYVYELNLRIMDDIVYPRMKFYDEPWYFVCHWMGDMLCRAHECTLSSIVCRSSKWRHFQKLPRASLSTHKTFYPMCLVYIHEQTNLLSITNDSRMGDQLQ